MSSFINDEKGVMEPYTDLPAMALAVVGFVIFTGLLSQTYITYEKKAFIAEYYMDAGNLAEKLSKDSLLTGGMGSGIIDASRIEELEEKPQEIMQRYGNHYNFMFKVEVDSDNRKFSWLIKDIKVGDPKNGISASVPVTVKINDVQELPGTLSVKIWGK